MKSANLMALFELVPDPSALPQQGKCSPLLENVVNSTRMSDRLATLSHIPLRCYCCLPQFATLSTPTFF